MFRFRRRISSFLSIPSSVCSVGDCTDSITSGYMTKKNFDLGGSTIRDFIVTSCMAKVNWHGMNRMCESKMGMYKNSRRQR